MTTEAELKQINEIRRKALYGSGSVDLTREAVKILVRRIDELSEPDHLLGAEPLMRWTLARLQEDLQEKRTWLAEQVEQMRIAELQVREAEHALAGVKALLEDGGMFKSGGEIIERWDAMEALYAAQGMLPAPEAPPLDPQDLQVLVREAMEEMDLVTEPQWSDEDVAQMKARGPAPELTINRIPEVPQPASLGAEQEVAILAALNDAAHGAPQVQIALKQLSDASRVPQGSCLPVLRRLADAGQIEIIKAPPKGKVQQPNFYRFVNVPRPAEPDPALADATALPAAPVPAHEVAGKLAEAWGGRVKPPKPAGSVSASAPLRERVLGMLSKAACTTSGLASMLDVKELAVCQTLEAMRHEGSVVADEMPEAGRRAQLWRPAA